MGLSSKEPSDPEKSLFRNLEGCIWALHMIREHHAAMPQMAAEYILDLTKEMESCAGLMAGDPKKLYNIVLDKLFQIKSDCHLPLKLYFNHTSPYWEFYRIFKSRPWGKFEPDSLNFDRYLAHLRAEKRRQKLHKMLIDDPQVPDQDANAEQDRNPLTLVKEDENYFSLRIGSRSVSSTKKRGQKTLPNPESRRQSIMSLQNSLQKMRGFPSTTSTSGAEPSILRIHDNADYF